MCVDLEHFSCIVYSCIWKMLGHILYMTSLIEDFKAS